MPFPSDLEIARQATLKPLDDIASEIGIGQNPLEPYGERHEDQAGRHRRAV
jgi:formate--tetrahydrofolate ligase